jgi:hypothetical protein
MVPNILKEYAASFFMVEVCDTYQNYTVSEPIRLQSKLFWLHSFQLIYTIKTFIKLYFFHSYLLTN